MGTKVNCPIEPCRYCYHGECVRGEITVVMSSISGKPRYPTCNNYIMELEHFKKDCNDCSSYKDSCDGEAFKQGCNEFKRVKEKEEDVSNSILELPGGCMS